MNQAQVLIADDDRNLTTSLADFVKMNGHGVSVASNGLEAAERFRQHEYDIAFVDIEMPVMNGVEGFTEIRKLRPNARIVMMTGFWQPIVEKAPGGAGHWVCFRRRSGFPNFWRGLMAQATRQ